MKDFFGEDLCAAAAQAYMESLLSGESGAKASEAAEIAYKAAPASRPTLPLPPSRLSATARAMQRWRPSSTRPLRTAMQWPTRSVPRQLWLSSMQRLPRARTRKQARRLRTLISRRTLPTMERGRRLAEKQLRLTSACFECHIESNFPLSSSRARKARNTFVRVKK